LILGRRLAEDKLLAAGVLKNRRSSMTNNAPKTDIWKAINRSLCFPSISLMIPHLYHLFGDDHVFWKKCFKINLL